jgi:alanine-synthesizing transaminase
MFPRLDPAVYKIEDDLALVMDILHQEKILVVQGSAFNVGDKQHLRLVFLPNEDELKKAIGKIDRLLANYRTT